MYHDSPLCERESRSDVTTGPSEGQPGTNGAPVVVGVNGGPAVGTSHASDIKVCWLICACDDQAVMSALSCSAGRAQDRAIRAASAPLFESACDGRGCIRTRPPGGVHRPCQGSAGRQLGHLRRHRGSALDAGQLYAPAVRAINAHYWYVAGSDSARPCSVSLIVR